MATRNRELEMVQDFAPDQAAQALLNLRCAVDHCHDAIFIADSNGKIEFVNAAFEAMTGYSAHEAMEGGLALIIKRDPTGDRKQTSASSGVALEEIMEKGFYRGAISTARKDARLIRLDLAVTVVRDYRTRAASVVCTARDITDDGKRDRAQAACCARRAPHVPARIVERGSGRGAELDRAARGRGQLHGPRTAGADAGRGGPRCQVAAGSPDSLVIA